MLNLHTLNRAVIQLAPQYIAAPLAPNTFSELLQHVASHPSRLVIWDGASDHTIYGDARVNHAFRAWHDATHIRLCAPFTPEGEASVCEAQIRDFYTAFPSAPLDVAKFLRAEINGQVQFALTHGGAFPTDQAAFITEVLSHA